MGRRCCLECGQTTGAGSERIEVGHLSIDGEIHAVSWRGQPVKLTPTLFRIVDVLASRAGREVTRDSLYMLNVMREDSEPRVLDMHMTRIRQAFRKADPEFDQIKTVWGTGWRWAK